MFSRLEYANKIVPPHRLWTITLQINTPAVEDLGNVFWERILKWINLLKLAIVFEIYLPSGNYFGQLYNRGHTNLTWKVHNRQVQIDIFLFGSLTHILHTGVGGSNGVAP